jgi:hypothetical protein
MSTSSVEISEALASDVRVTSDKLKVELNDGRTVIVPLQWFPRLKYGTPRERNHWELIADGYGIHWPELDEDISVEGLLDGRRSGESQRSLKRWMENRTERQAGRRQKAK